MDIKKLRGKLEERGFETCQHLYSEEIGRILLENVLEVWHKDNRVIAIKEYINEIHFENWVHTDKMLLVAILKMLGRVEKNNLYFLICLDIENDINFKIREEINKLEKDSKICKKYVLVTDEDIQRIPFISDSDIQLPKMLDYEVQFKEKLKNISNVTGNSIEIAIEYFDN